MALLEGMTRRLTKISMGISNFVAGFDDQGQLRVVTSKPDYGELSRARRVYGGSSATGTALAPVTAVPTVGPNGFALFNGEDAGGRVYTPLFVSAWLVSGTAGLGASLLASTSIAPVTGTKPTAYASAIISSLSGGPTSPKAVFATGATLVGTPAWVQLGGRDVPAAIEVGAAIVADTKGIFKVPPQYTFNVVVLAPTGSTALWGVGIVWAESEEDLE